MNGMNDVVEWLEMLFWIIVGNADLIALCLVLLACWLGMFWIISLGG